MSSYSSFSLSTSAGSAPPSTGASASASPLLADTPSPSSSLPRYRSLSRQEMTRQHEEFLRNRADPPAANTSGDTTAPRRSLSVAPVEPVEPQPFAPRPAPIASRPGPAAAGPSVSASTAAAFGQPFHPLAPRQPLPAAVAFGRSHLHPYQHVADRTQSAPAPLVPDAGGNPLTSAVHGTYPRPAASAFAEVPVSVTAPLLAPGSLRPGENPLLEQIAPAAEPPSPLGDSDSEYLGSSVDTPSRRSTTGGPATPQTVRRPRAAQFPTDESRIFFPGSYSTYPVGNLLFFGDDEEDAAPGAEPESGPAPTRVADSPALLARRPPATLATTAGAPGGSKCDVCDSLEDYIRQMEKAARSMAHNSIQYEAKIMSCHRYYQAKIASVSQARGHMVPGDASQETLSLLSAKALGSLHNILNSLSLQIDAALSTQGLLLPRAPGGAGTGELATAHAKARAVYRESALVFSDLLKEHPLTEAHLTSLTLEQGCQILESHIHFAHNLVSIALDSGPIGSFLGRGVALLKHLAQQMTMFRVAAQRESLTEESIRRKLDDQYLAALRKSDQERDIAKRLLEEAARRQTRSDYELAGANSKIAALEELLATERARVADLEAANAALKDQVQQLEDQRLIDQARAREQESKQQARARELAEQLTLERARASERETVLNKRMRDLAAEVAALESEKAQVVAEAEAGLRQSEAQSAADLADLRASIRQLRGKLQVADERNAQGRADTEHLRLQNAQLERQLTESMAELRQDNHQLGESLRAMEAELVDARESATRADGQYRQLRDEHRRLADSYDELARSRDALQETLSRRVSSLSVRQASAHESEEDPEGESWLAGTGGSRRAGTPSTGALSLEDLLGHAPAVGSAAEAGALGEAPPRRRMGAAPSSDMIDSDRTPPLEGRDNPAGTGWGIYAYLSKIGLSESFPPPDKALDVSVFQEDSDGSRSPLACDSAPTRPRMSPQPPGWSTAPASGGQSGSHVSTPELLR
ncbi:hypothetical protein H696_03139 [Fonticula alba]|uniref:Uncharacterized protein n=1 Tax=Fonticula alba TaxID=691883 RepID=A0A058ZA27_FONAL|nr:hypothetical protein H696_03139 [Fonticula alba]KCV70788.1 hypothetical protein H696_03139 [Fonticula alba]|eukprot:XP_009495304.1 hypothetical protein H696_03139 [Fonticula alba]